MQEYCIHCIATYFREALLRSALQKSASDCVSSRALEATICLLGLQFSPEEKLSWSAHCVNMRLSFWVITVAHWASWASANPVQPDPVYECYANISDPYLLFATKTSYFTVDNEDTEPIQIEGKIMFDHRKNISWHLLWPIFGQVRWHLEKWKSIVLYVSGCRAKSFWLLARHGSRNPGDDDISQMEIRGPEIQAAILDNHQHGKGK